jgi:hypothetical protein
MPTTEKNTTVFAFMGGLASGSTTACNLFSDKNLMDKMIGLLSEGEDHPLVRKHIT